MSSGRSELSEFKPKSPVHVEELRRVLFPLPHFWRLSKNWLQGEICLHGIAKRGPSGCPLPDQGEGQGVGLGTAARYTKALAQKENLNARRVQ